MGDGLSALQGVEWIISGPAGEHIHGCMAGAAWAVWGWGASVTVLKWLGRLHAISVVLGFSGSYNQTIHALILAFTIWPWTSRGGARTTQETGPEPERQYQCPSQDPRDARRLTASVSEPGSGRRAISLWCARAPGELGHVRGAKGG